MNKILLTLTLTFAASCNPLSTTTNIDTGFKPGLPASKQPAPPANRYKSSHGFVISSGAGQASSTNMTGDFEVSQGESKIKGSSIEADIKFESTDVR